LTSPHLALRHLNLGETRYHAKQGKDEERRQNGEAIHQALLRKAASPGNDCNTPPSTAANKALLSPALTTVA
jgi:hypothetical protein